MEQSQFVKEKFEKFQEYLDSVRKKVGEEIYKKIAIHLVDSYSAGIKHSVQLDKEASQLELLVFGLRFDILDKYVL